MSLTMRGFLGCGLIAESGTERTTEYIIGKSRISFFVSNCSKMVFLYRTWGNSLEAAPFLSFCDCIICAMPATLNRITDIRAIITTIVVSIA